MLQQTQMDRGVIYFNRWINRFPDIRSVAEASENELFKFWEGLGYYSRVRNLQKAAQIIVARFNGEIPCEVEHLLNLPGIGPYTAAAISSIACNKAIAVVDANVLRVYARIFDIDQPVQSGAGRKKVEQIAQALLPTNRARSYNQAIMDLGGLVCTAQKPDCFPCPVQEFCEAHKHARVALRPLPKKKQEKILIEMATGIIQQQGKLFIQQRYADDIWGGLWEFPGGKVEEDETPEEAVIREFMEETNLRVKISQKITSITHFHTKYKVVLHCYFCAVVGSLKQFQLNSAQACRWVDPVELAQYAFPAGHRKLIELLQARGAAGFSGLSSQQD